MSSRRKEVTTNVGLYNKNTYNWWVDGNDEVFLPDLSHFTASRTIFIEQQADKTAVSDSDNMEIDLIYELDAMSESKKIDAIMMDQDLLFNLAELEAEDKVLLSQDCPPDLIEEEKDAHCNGTTASIPPPAFVPIVSTANIDNADYHLKFKVIMEDVSKNAHHHQHHHHHCHDDARFNMSSYGGDKTVSASTLITPVKEKKAGGDNDIFPFRWIRPPAFEDTSRALSIRCAASRALAIRCAAKFAAAEAAAASQPVKKKVKRAQRKKAPSSKLKKLPAVVSPLRPPRKSPPSAVQHQKCYNDAALDDDEFVYLLMDYNVPWP